MLHYMSFNSLLLLLLYFIMTLLVQTPNNKNQPDILFLIKLNGGTKRTRRKSNLITCNECMLANIIGANDSKLQS